jgi:hypothetical protein
VRFNVKKLNKMALKKTVGDNISNRFAPLEEYLDVNVYIGMVSIRQNFKTSVKKGLDYELTA